MAEDFIGMQTRVANEVQDGNITAETKLAILDAIKVYRGTRFYFNQKIATFSTVANQEYYGVADNSDIPNLITIDTMTVGLNSILTPMDAQTFAAIDGQQSGQSVGRPEVFASYGQRIRFYPIPDQVYPIAMPIHYRLPDLSADADTNAWMTDAEILIRQCAKRLMAADVIQEPGIAQGAGPIEQEAFDALMNETRLRRSKTHLYVDPALAGWGWRPNIYAGF